MLTVLKIRFLHFLHTLYKSPFLVGTSIALFLVCAGILIICDDNNDLSRTLIVGIFASIIATLILRLLDKSDESYYANLSVINEAWFLIRYIKTKERTVCHNWQEESLTIRSLYLEICRISKHINYKNDFNRISNAIDEIIDAIDNRRDNLCISTSVSRLQSLLESIQCANISQ